MATLTKDSVVAGHKLSNLILEYKKVCDGCIFYANNSNNICTSNEEEINSIAKVISNGIENKCCGISMYIIITKSPYTPIQPKVLIEGKEGGKVGTYPVTVIVFDPKGKLKDIKIANFDIYSKFRTSMITFNYTGNQLICKSHNLIAKFI